MYVASGTYSQAITLAADVSVYGGYDALDWLRDIDVFTTKIEAGPIAVRGVGADNVTLDGLDIRSLDAMAANTSSIAVSFSNSQGITLSRNKIKAGNGANGSTGASG